MRPHSLANAWPIARLLFVLPVGAVFIALFVPVWPTFPVGTHLDNSWVSGLNAAMGLGFVYGHEVIFTFGPYASVYTREYHPATDTIMLLGGTLLAVGYALLLAALARTRGLAAALGLAIAMLVLFRDMDAILFMYPLAFSVLIFLRYVSHERPLENGSVFELAVVTIPFGMLPLIKGSALIGCAAISVLCVAALLLCGRRREAAVMVVVPVVACLALWVIAGQPVSALPWYFINMFSIVSGFTDAMSGWGPASEIYVYLAACAAVLAGVAATRREGMAPRIFLMTAFGLYLFLAFKAGFVRHDGHVLMAASAVGIAGLLTLFVRAPCAPLIAVTAFSSWAYLDAAYAKTNTETLVERAINPFLALKGGWEARTQGRLDEISAAAWAKLARECPIDPLTGTADVYSYRQACLLASGVRWSPRPVFQSYSAYTPRLARLNADHLRSAQAPDHVLFRAEPIDGRLPSLEDGASWPALLGLYQPRWMDGDLAYLQRRPGAAEAKPRFIEQRVVATGEGAALPDSDGLLFAEIELERTVLGRLASLVFKPIAPRIELILRDGGRRSHRFVPGMAAGGFVLSPYVANTREFVLLMESYPELAANRVQSFSIELDAVGRWLWRGDYSMRLSHLPARASGTAVGSLLLDLPYTAGAVPANATGGLVCDGSVDRLNGASPVPMTLTSGTRVTLDGWTAVSHNEGRLPDTVLVAVTNGRGESTYFRTRRTERADVSDFFKQPGLLNSGFEARIDVGDLGDEVFLQVAQLRGGALFLCDPARRIAIRK
jgi:hypothetical protein